MREKHQRYNSIFLYFQHFSFFFFFFPPRFFFIFFFLYKIVMLTQRVCHQSVSRARESIQSL